jgi:hypothetical protein
VDGDGSRGQRNDMVGREEGNSIEREKAASMIPHSSRLSLGTRSRPNVGQEGPANGV